jgi:hypothetical protein
MSVGEKRRKVGRRKTNRRRKKDKRTFGTEVQYVVGSPPSKGVPPMSCWSWVVEVASF